MATIRWCPIFPKWDSDTNPWFSSRNQQFGVCSIPKCGLNMIERSQTQTQWRFEATTTYNGSKFRALGTTDGQVALSRKPSHLLGFQFGTHRSAIDSPSRNGIWQNHQRTWLYLTKKNARITSFNINYIYIYVIIIYCICWWTMMEHLHSLVIPAFRRDLHRCSRRGSEIGTKHVPQRVKYAGSLYGSGHGRRVRCAQQPGPFHGCPVGWRWSCSARWIGKWSTVGLEVSHGVFSDKATWTTCCEEVIDLAMRPGEPRETRVALGGAEKRGESPRKRGIR